MRKKEDPATFSDTASNILGDPRKDMACVTPSDLRDALKDSITQTRFFKFLIPHLISIFDRIYRAIDHIYYPIERAYALQLYREDMKNTQF